MVDGMIVAWLNQKRTSMWGQGFGLHDGSLVKAAEWWERELNDYAQFRRRVLAGTAIERILASDVGGSDHPVSEFVSQDERVDPSDLPGHLNPPGPPSSGDSEHPGRDEGDQQGDRGVQANADYHWHDYSDPSIGSGGYWCRCDDPSS